MQNNCKAEIVTGKSKKDVSKQWTAVKFSIGDWSTMIFTKSKIELDYIKNHLEKQA